MHGQPLTQLWLGFWTSGCLSCFAEEPQLHQAWGPMVPIPEPAVLRHQCPTEPWRWQRPDLAAQRLRGNSIADRGSLVITAADRTEQCPTRAPKLRRGSTEAIAESVLSSLRKPRHKISTPQPASPDRPRHRSAGYRLGAPVKEPTAWAVRKLQRAPSEKCGRYSPAEFRAIFG